MPLPYQDRMAGMSPVFLLNIAAGLSLSVLAMSTTYYVYNLPLFLFGLVAHEMHSSTELLRSFLNLLFWSGIFDLFAILTAGYQAGFARIFALIVLVLKVPIGVTCTNVLRDRGGQYSLGGMIPGRPGGQGNWTMPSMPGGFGAPASNQTSNVVGVGGAGGPGAGGGGSAAFPSSGGYRLGGEEDGTSGGPPPAPAPGRNGYSSIA